MIGTKPCGKRDGCRNVRRESAGRLTTRAPCIAAHHSSGGAVSLAWSDGHCTSEGCDSSAGGRRASSICAASSSARASPTVTPPGPGALSAFSHPASAIAAITIQRPVTTRSIEPRVRSESHAHARRSLLDDARMRVVLVEMGADHLQVAGVGAEHEIEQVTRERDRAHRRIEADVRQHARQPKLRHA
jgi:hypothetical protein